MRQKRLKASASSNECGECEEACDLEGVELYEMIASEGVEPNANKWMVMAGPDPVAQARDLVLLSNAAKVSKLEKAMQEVRAFFCRQHLQHSRTTTHSNAETTTRLTQPAGHRCVDRIRRRTLSGWSSAVA